MDLLQQIRAKAKQHSKRIVLPEGTEERTLKAANEVLEEGLAQIILIGNPDEIKKLASEMSLNHIEKATIVNPLSHEKKDTYIDLMVEIRKNKGLTREDATKLIEDPLYLAVLMIKNGDADGEVAGAANATGDVLRPAFQYVKTAPGISVVSGAFIMILKDEEFGENGIMVLLTVQFIQTQQKKSWRRLQLQLGKQQGQLPVSNQELQC
jgi:phosphate acetyltransferase